MTQWTAVSRTEHAQSCFWPRERYHFSARQEAVPVVMAELGKLIPLYTLGFVKENDTYQLVAILGLGQGNLYLHPEGKWLGGYVPALMRAYPFRLVNNQNDEAAVCIASDHLTDEPSAKPLFEGDALAEDVAQSVEFLKHYEQNRRVTVACVQKLSEAGALQDWPLQVNRGQGQEPFKVNGLYRVDEQALNALSAEDFHALRGGPLSIAYAQILSTHQLAQLSQRAELLAKAKAHNEVPENLDALFEDDDDLSFDFDS